MMCVLGFGTATFLFAKWQQKQPWPGQPSDLGPRGWQSHLTVRALEPRAHPKGRYLFRSCRGSKHAAFPLPWGEGQEVLEVWMWRGQVWEDFPYSGLGPRRPRGAEAMDAFLGTKTP